MHGPRIHLRTGFAAAVLPVSASTIVTDTSGLDAGEVQIPAGDTAIPGYRAMPATGKTPPVVIVVQEIFGVHEHIKDVCRRFAKLGYMAIAPEMYARQGDVSGMSDIQEIIEKVVSKVPDAQVMSDLDATVAWAESTGNGDTARLGITGFCWGGRTVWLYAAHSAKLKAGGAWYGQFIGLQNEYRTRTALDVAPKLKAPVIGFYGGQDHGIPLEQVDRMQRALRDAGRDSEIIVYPDAGHGFFADYRPGYDESAAQDAWANLLEWFRKHGVA
jgi:carboxymethylenebutenolidase